MTFSVIIPVYNRTVTLKSAIESVLCQSFKDFEIIVVDDGSNDSVAKSLKPYMGLIHYIRIDKNKGVSHARNIGIKASNGQYIAFLDSDDLWLPNKLQAQCNELNKTGLQVCHTNEFWYRKDKFVNQGKKHNRYGGKIFDKVLDFCRISPSSVAIEKRAFDSCGMFNEKMRTCEDYDLWLRLTSKFDICYLPEKLIIKRAISDDQLSDTITHIEYIRLVSLSRFVKHHPIPPSQRQAAIKEICRKYDIISYRVKNF